jgi:LysM repeat protein/rare lipoprotein A (peptidoglycan hydrolase)
MKTLIIRGLVYLCKDMKHLLNRLFCKVILIIFCALMASSTAHATMLPDSLRTKWVDGKKYLLHKVVAKETWTSVADKYNTTISELQKANPGVSVLKTNQIIQVPADKISDKQIKEEPKVETPKEEQKKEEKKKEESTGKSTKVKYHTVAKGETLYRISKENDLTVDELKELNNLTSNNVKVGQKLIVGKESSTSAVKSEPKAEVTKPKTNDIAVETPVKSVEPTVPTKTKNEEQYTKQVAEQETTKVRTEPIKTAKVDTPSVYSNPGTSRNSVVEKDPKSGIVTDRITENGVATWITDGELNQNKFYALHRTAPIGTIIKITNRMNNNSVFVKVIGFLPDTGDNANIIIKITQAAAQRIGAIDQRFQAELSYGVTK